MFVRKKTVNGQVYHYLVRSVRQNGKVRQEALAYLGKFATVAEALEKLTVYAETARRNAAGCLARAETSYQQKRKMWLGKHEWNTRRAEKLEAKIQKLRPFAV